MLAARFKTAAGQWLCCVFLTDEQFVAVIVTVGDGVLPVADLYAAGIAIPFVEAELSGFEAIFIRNDGFAFQEPGLLHKKYAMRIVAVDAE